MGNYWASTGEDNAIITSLPTENQIESSTPEQQVVCVSSQNNWGLVNYPQGVFPPDRLERSHERPPLSRVFEYKTTKIVRTSLSVNKSSLRLTPVTAGHHRIDTELPQFYYLDFRYTATTPVRITVVVDGTPVDSTDETLSSKFNSSVDGFPSSGIAPPGQDAKFRCSKVLDIRVLPLEKLRRMSEEFSNSNNPTPEGNRESFSGEGISLKDCKNSPVIITIAALGIDGMREATPSQQLVVYCAVSTSSWANLKADTGKRFEPIPLTCFRQNLLYDGRMFDLQEIYGIDGGGGNEGSRNSALASATVSQPEGSVAATDSGTWMEGRECVICLTNPRTTTVLPCRHHCLCDSCAIAMRLRDNRCPICRQLFASLLKIQAGTDSVERSDFTRLQSVDGTGISR